MRPGPPQSEPNNERHVGDVCERERGRDCPSTRVNNVFTAMAAPLYSVLPTDN